MRSGHFWPELKRSAHSWAPKSFRSSDPGSGALLHDPIFHTLCPPWDLQSWHWAWLGASRWIDGTPGESFGHLYGRASSAVIFWTCTKWSPNASSSHIFWGDVFDPPYNPQQAQLQNFGQVWLVCFHNTTLAIACAAIAKVSQVHRPRPFSWRDQASYRGQRLPPLPFGGPLALCLQSIGEERRILGEHRELKNPQVGKWPKIEHLNF